MKQNSLATLLQDALSARRDLIHTLELDNTDCYRLFHGSAEGFSGVTVDRYGQNLLIQSFHTALKDEEVQLIMAFYLENSPINNVFYHDRCKGAKQARNCIYGGFDDNYMLEGGIKYYCNMAHTGQDPLLFLDFRAARRLIGSECVDKTLLNTFSFSCGVAVSAVFNGAKHATNLDFSSSALAAGRLSQQANNIEPHRINYIEEDYFLAIRQMAGLSIPVRKQQKNQSFRRYPKQSFDMVVLDPPRWAKSKFGTVDLVRDYNSVLKPAIMTVADQGKLFCTNNVAQVDQQQWLDSIERCCIKNERKVKSLTVVNADADFPSFDENHPLKQALITFA